MKCVFKWFWTISQCDSTKSNEKSILETFFPMLNLLKTDCLQIKQNHQSFSSENRTQFSWKNVKPVRMTGTQREAATAAPARTLRRRVESGKLPPTRQLSQMGRKNGPRMITWRGAAHVCGCAGKALRKLSSFAGGQPVTRRKIGFFGSLMNGKVLQEFEFGCLIWRVNYLIEKRIIFRLQLSLLFHVFLHYFFRQNALYQWISNI